MSIREHIALARLRYNARSEKAWEEKVGPRATSDRDDDGEISPHRLLQELVPADAWHVFVVCILQNRTTGSQVEAMIDGLLERYPTPLDLATAELSELEALLRPLGLWRRRARTLVEMSRRVASGEWSDPLDLPGVGQYAVDSYEIFVKGNLDVPAKDSWLQRYLEWRGR